jgi:hypothetical protein
MLRIILGCDLKKTKVQSGKKKKKKEIKKKKMWQRSHHVHTKKMKNYCQKPTIKQRALNTLPKASSTPHKPRANQLFNN